MKKVKNSRIFNAVLPQTTSFSESVNLKTSLGIFISVFLLSFTITLGTLLFQTFGEYQLVIAEHGKIQNQLSYWEGIIQKHPRFPAGYYEAAVYAIQLDKIDTAREYLHAALEVDPNFFEAEVLAKEIESR